MGAINIMNAQCDLSTFTATPVNGVCAQDGRINIAIPGGNACSATAVLSQANQDDIAVVLNANGTATFPNLKPGVYQVYLVGQTTTQPKTVTVTSSYTQIVTNVSATNTSCSASNDSNPSNGIVNYNFTGGIGPFVISLKQGNNIISTRNAQNGNANSFNNVAAGSYDLEIRDTSATCSNTIIVSVIVNETIARNLEFYAIRRLIDLDCQPMIRVQLQFGSLIENRVVRYTKGNDPTVHIVPNEDVNIALGQYFIRGIDFNETINIVATDGCTTLTRTVSSGIYNPSLSHNTTLTTNAECNTQVIYSIRGHVNSNGVGIWNFNNTTRFDLYSENSPNSDQWTLLRQSQNMSELYGSATRYRLVVDDPTKRYKLVLRSATTFCDPYEYILEAATVNTNAVADNLFARAYLTERNSVLEGTVGFTFDTQGGWEVVHSFPSGVEFFLDKLDGSRTGTITATGPYNLAGSYPYNFPMIIPAGSTNFVNNAPFFVDLPPGEYRLVARDQCNNSLADLRINLNNPTRYNPVNDRITVEPGCLNSNIAYNITGNNVLNESRVSLVENNNGVEGAVIRNYTENSGLLLQGNFANVPPGNYFIKFSEINGVDNIFRPNSRHIGQANTFSIARGISGYNQIYRAPITVEPYEQLDFSTTALFCNPTNTNSGLITVTTSGTPVGSIKYELWQGNSAVGSPLRTHTSTDFSDNSYVFNNLPVGTYTIRVTTDCGDLTRGVTLINGPVTIPNPTASSTTVCHNEEVTLSIPLPTSVFDIVWKDNTGAIIGTGVNNITVNVLNPTPTTNRSLNYTVDYSLRQSLGCSNSLSESKVISLTVKNTNVPQFVIDSSNQSIVENNITVEYGDHITNQIDLAAIKDGRNVTVVKDEERIDGDCDNEFTLIRTWVATGDCGLSTTYRQTINVVDTTAPYFVDQLPDDVTISCTETIPAQEDLLAYDRAGIFSSYVPSVSGGNSSIGGGIGGNIGGGNSARGVLGSGESYDIIDVTVTDVRVNGNCPNNYVIERTYRAIDACDNSVQHVQRITVEDTTAPTFVGSLPGDITASCDAIPTPVTLTATDTCGTATVSSTDVIIPGLCANSYIIERTFRAVDQCGNFTDHLQTITIQDITAPTFVETLPLATIEAECGAVPPAAVLTATDNCTDDIEVDYREVRTDGNCANNYTLTRTWRATDECGNTTSHVQTVLVKDTKAPVFVEALPLASIVAECNLVPPAAVLTATDNCTDDIEVDYREVRTNGNCTNNYTLTRTWTATDECGNTTSHVQTVNVQDTKAPVFNGTLPLATIEAECGAVPAAVTLTATDNCGTATVTLNEVRTDGNCPNNYTLTRTWTATDICGNTTSHVQTVLVKDTQAPVFNETLPSTVLLVECNAVPTAAVLTATDNCTANINVVYTETRLNGSCANNYTLTRTWTASDECGNRNVHVQTILVQDTTAPVFVETLPLATMIVSCDAVPAAAVLTATDNCGTATVAFTETRVDGSCVNDYTLTRTWTATDACGRFTRHTQTIIVEDTTAPTFVETLPSDVTVECDSVPAAEVLTAVDNCESTIVPTTVSFTETRTDGSCVNNYTLTRTWLATDACGNTTEHVQVVTVQDTTAPTFVEALPADAIVECDSVPAADVLTATDNCESTIVPTTVEFTETRTDGDCENNYTLTRTWVATDACGNTSEHVQVLTVQDTTAPTFNDADNLPADLTIECDETIPSVETLTAFDNCDTDVEVSFAEVKEAGSCANEYKLVRTWTATDNCGNSTEHVQTITVQDTKAPTFVGTLPSSEIYIKCDDLQVAETLTAIDTCGDVTVESFDERVDSDCVAKYDIIRTWVATDACGNSTEYVQTIHLSCSINVFNGVTPNGDGLNDELVLEGIECYPGNTVEIFNRWGVLVYETKEYNSNGNTFKGLSEGRATIVQDGLLPTGTYYYVIKYNLDLGNGTSYPIEQAGHIHLETNSN